MLGGGAAIAGTLVVESGALLGGSELILGRFAGGGASALNRSSCRIPYMKPHEAGKKDTLQHAENTKDTQLGPLGLQR